MVSQDIAKSQGRFWAEVEDAGPDECWIWNGGRFQKGYGAFSYKNHRPGYAHRYSYELHHGPIPKGELVMHTCDNPPCVNPAHLRLGSYSDNIKDSVRKERWMSYKRQEKLKRTHARYRRLIDETRHGYVPVGNRVYVPERPDEGWPMHVFVVG